MANSFQPQSQRPLTVDEVISLVRGKWSVTYDLRIIVRRKSIYLEIMWAYFEQKSFPMEEDEFLAHLNKSVEVINRLGLSHYVRKWLVNTNEKPRLGKPASIKLSDSQSSSEFVL